MIHPRLIADTHLLGSFSNSTVLLHRNSAVPWFMLVPDTDISEFLELDSGLQSRLLEESTCIAAFVKAHFGCERINFASIGNIVSQLHLHVIGRSSNDVCWPQPVWGHLSTERVYSNEQVDTIRTELSESYGLILD